MISSSIQRAKNGFWTVLILVASTEGFDSTLDTAGHTLRWKFEGSYVYASTLQDIQELTPLLQAGSIGSTTTASNITAAIEPENRHGIWFTKYTPAGQNQWNVSFYLTHLLLVQTWVTYLAHPSVPLIIQSVRGKEIQRFWSDGMSWCDAVVNMNYKNQFIAEMNVRKPGEYAMVDKIVLGIMGNVTSLKKHSLNPCLLIPLTVDNDKMEELDIEVKQTKNEVRREVQQGPPDMEVKNETIGSRVPTKRPEYSKNGTKTESSLRTYQTESGGAKCNCICTCAKPTNNTSSTTEAPQVF